MPTEDHKTAYSPGDLYDLLSTSVETRFHAALLFLRYFLYVGIPSEDEASISENEDLETVIWDTAVACLALSVKVSASCTHLTEALAILDPLPSD